jgi:YVTN family beta-propeller protein
MRWNRICNVLFPAVVLLSLSPAGAADVRGTVEVGELPIWVASDELNQRAYVAAFKSNWVAVIDESTGLVERTFAVNNPAGVGVNPLTERIYVTAVHESKLYVFERGSDTPLDSIDVGRWPYSVAVNPVTGLVYVANLGGNSVTVIQELTHVKVADIFVGVGPISVTVDPTRNRIYSSNHFSGNVAMIDGLTHTVLGTLPVGPYPAGISVDPLNGLLYVARGWRDNLAVIDATTLTHVTTVFGVGRNPYGVAAAPLDGLVYVTSYDDDTLAVVETATHTVLQTLPVGSAPRGVGLSHRERRLCVANSGSGTASLIAE